MRPCPRIAPTLPSIEVEVEAEAATRELGGAAPITRRATNQARAPYVADTRANKARGMDPSETKTWTYGCREAGDFPGPFSAGFFVAPASVVFPPSRWLVMLRAGMARSACRARHWSWFTE